MKQEVLSKYVPACKRLANGEVAIDHRAIFMLALPLVLNSAIQAILNVTDTWFVGRISVSAMAALSVVVWPAMAVLILFGSTGMAVQTYASRVLGEGRRAFAAHYGILGLWAALVMSPCFLIFAGLGKYIFAPFHLSPEVLNQALEWWMPRVGGGMLGAVFSALTGFFNATGRTRVTLYLTVLLAVVNIPCNYFFISQLGWGIAGSAWGTNAALLLTSLLGMGVLFSSSYRRYFKTHRVWRPNPQLLKKLIVTSLGIGGAISIDLTGYSLFQLMQAQVGLIEGAATQTVIALTALGYFPAIGFGIAGTTLVGQSLGAAAPEWAFKMGNVILKYIFCYMMFISVIFFVFADQIAVFFLVESDPNALKVSLLVSKLLCFAAIYQIPDGFHLGSSFCLRGAKDVVVTGRIVACTSFLIFIPLCHSLTFDAKQAWISGLPQWGLGAIGGWSAVVCYMFLLGGLLYARWYSRAWVKA